MAAPLLGPAVGVSAFAATHLGLESILGRELSELGATDLAPEPGGVGFAAGPEVIYRANLCLRSATRVLIRIGTIHARTFGELERHANKIRWSDWIRPTTPVHFRVTSKKSKLYHEDAIAERLIESARRVFPGLAEVPRRGEVDEREGDVTGPPKVQRFVVRFLRDQCQLSIDTSGPPLHRRGYRLESGKAPIRETLAAGLIIGSGWRPGAPFADPFCGSGTIPIEAAMIARGIPPGWRRRFAFEHFPSFDAARFAATRSETESAILPRSPSVILGNDRDQGAIAAATANAERAGVAGDIRWRCAPLSALEVPAEPGWLVTNPPYGTRVGDAAGLRDLYAQLGHVLRRVCRSWQVAIVDADRRLSGQMALPWRELARTENGGIPIRFLTASVSQ